MQFRRFGVLYNSMIRLSYIPWSWFTLWINRRYGSIKWPFSEKKSYAGSAAFVAGAFTTSTVLLAFLSVTGSLVGINVMNLLPQLLLISILCALVELVPIGEFTLPLEFQCSTWQAFKNSFHMWCRGWQCDSTHSCRCAVMGSPLAIVQSGLPTSHQSRRDPVMYPTLHSSTHKLSVLRHEIYSSYLWIYQGSWPELFKPVNINRSWLVATLWRIYYWSFLDEWENLWYH